VRFAFDLGLEENFLPQLIPTIAGIYDDHYPEVAQQTDTVVAVLAKEEQQFRRTLRKGIKQMRSYRRDGLTGAELFVLYDTFGFPVELSTEEARRSGIAMSDSWREEFDAHMTAQRERSQRGAAAG
jgi:alanyl-tRNA synthetase